MSKTIQSKPKALKSIFIQNKNVTIEFKPDVDNPNYPSVYVNPTFIRHIKLALRKVPVEQMDCAPKCDVLDKDSKDSDYVELLNSLIAKVAAVRGELRCEYSFLKNESKDGRSSKDEVSEYTPTFRVITSEPGVTHKDMTYSEDDYSDIAAIISNIFELHIDVLLGFPSHVASLLKDTPNPKLVEYDHNKLISMVRSHTGEITLDRIKKLNHLDQVVNLLDISLQSALVIFPLIDTERIINSCFEKNYVYGSRVAYRVSGEQVSARSPIQHRVFVPSDRPMLPLRVTMGPSAIRDTPNGLSNILFLDATLF